MLVLFSFFLRPLSAQQIFHLDFEESSGTSSTEEQINGAVLGINNHFNRPERIEGPKGQALHMDGRPTSTKIIFRWTVLALK